MDEFGVAQKQVQLSISNMRLYVRNQPKSAPSWTCRRSGLIFNIEYLEQMFYEYHLFKMGHTLYLIADIALTQLLAP